MRSRAQLGMLQLATWPALLSCYGMLVDARSASAEAAATGIQAHRLRKAILQARQRCRFSAACCPATPSTGQRWQAADRQSQPAIPGQGGAPAFSPAVLCATQNEKRSLFYSAAAEIIRRKAAKVSAGISRRPNLAGTKQSCWRMVMDPGEALAESAGCNGTAQGIPPSDKPTSHTGL